MNHRTKLFQIVLASLLSAALSCYAQPAPAAGAPGQGVNAEATASKVDTLPPGLPKIKPIEHKDIAYRQIGGQDLKLDVYEQPDGKPAPVVVYWHGGAWWKGERPATYGSFRALLGMGFSVVSVDYRLTDVALAPAAVEDVRCSLAWVKKNSGEYHFDTSRIVAYGTSAGGHLALMAGFLPAKNSIDPPECGEVPQVAAIMDYYGIPDVEAVITSGISLAKSTVRWLGDGPDTLARASRMSPVTYLRPGLPAVFIAHGDADPTVPYQQSIDLRKSLESLHVPVEMVTVPSGVHGQFSPDQTPIINEALQKFFVDRRIIAAAPK
jgi:acetyl esterase/lipase